MSDWPKQSIRKNPRSAGLKPHHKEGASKTVGCTKVFGKPLSSVEASSLTRSKQAAWLNSSQPNMPRMVYHSMAFQNGKFNRCRLSGFYLLILNFWCYGKIDKRRVVDKEC